MIDRRNLLIESYLENGDLFTRNKSKSLILRSDSDCIKDATKKVGYRLNNSCSLIDEFNKNFRSNFNRTKARFSLNGQKDDSSFNDIEYNSPLDILNSCSSFGSDINIVSSSSSHPLRDSNSKDSLYSLGEDSNKSISGANPARGEQSKPVNFSSLSLCSESDDHPKLLNSESILKIEPLNSIQVSESDEYPQCRKQSSLSKKTTTNISERLLEFQFSHKDTDLSIEKSKSCQDDIDELPLSPMRRSSKKLASPAGLNDVISSRPSCRQFASKSLLCDHSSFASSLFVEPNSTSESNSFLLSELSDISFRRDSDLTKPVADKLPPPERRVDGSNSPKQTLYTHFSTENLDDKGSVLDQTVSRNLEDANTIKMRHNPSNPQFFTNKVARKLRNQCKSFMTGRKYKLIDQIDLCDRKDLSTPNAIPSNSSNQLNSKTKRMAKSVRKIFTPITKSSLESSNGHDHAFQSRFSILSSSYNGTNTQETSGLKKNKRYSKKLKSATLYGTSFDGFNMDMYSNEPCFMDDSSISSLFSPKSLNFNTKKKPDIFSEDNNNNNDNLDHNYNDNSKNAASRKSKYLRKLLSSTNKDGPHDSSDTGDLDHNYNLKLVPFASNKKIRAKKRLSCVAKSNEKGYPGLENATQRSECLPSPKSEMDLKLIFGEYDENSIVFESDDLNIYSKDFPAIKAATIENLIIALTPELYTDADFIFTFILTYNLFSTLEQVLSLLELRWNAPPSDILSGSEVVIGHELHSKRLIPIRLRIINLLRIWLEVHVLESDKYTLELLKHFIYNVILRDMPKFEKAFERLISDVSIQKISAELMFTEKPPKPHIPNNIQKKMTLLDLDPEEVARQMTLIDSELFIKIKPQEFLMVSMEKPGKKERFLTIHSMIDIFNKLSNWFITQILSQDDIFQRVSVLSRAIQIAKRCSELRNYNGLMEVLSALSSSSIYRLYKTWKLISPKLLRIYYNLSSIMGDNERGNFYLYRKIISSTIPPTIPYLGVYLTDLKFLCEGNKDLIGGKMVNWHKMTKISKVVESIVIKQSPYCLVKVGIIQDLLLNGEILEDPYKRSVELEKRISKIDKDFRKTFKRESLDDSNKLEVLFLSLSKALFNEIGRINGALLAFCWPSLVQLVDTDSVSVLVWLCRFLGEILRLDSQGEYTVQIAGIVLNLMEKRDNFIVSATCQTYCHLIPRALEFIRDHPDLESSIILWKNITQIKGFVIEHITSSQPSVCLRACRCVETLFLNMTEENYCPTSQNVSFKASLRATIFDVRSLKDVDNPILKPELLEHDAWELLCLLLRKMNNSLTLPSAAIITGIFSLLCNIVRVRTQYTELITEAFLYFHSYVPDVASKTQRQSIRYSLRLAMAMITKYRIPGKWNDTLRQCLEGHIVRRGGKRFRDVPPSTSGHPLINSTGTASSNSRFLSHGAVFDPGTSRINVRTTELEKIAQSSLNRAKAVTTGTSSTLPNEKQRQPKVTELTPSVTSEALIRIVINIMSRISPTMALPTTLYSVFAFLSRFAAQLAFEDKAVLKLRELLKVLFSSQFTSHSGKSLLIIWLYTEYYQAVKLGILEEKIMPENLKKEQDGSKMELDEKNIENKEDGSASTYNNNNDKKNGNKFATVPAEDFSCSEISNNQKSGLLDSMDIEKPLSSELIQDTEMMPTVDSRDKDLVNKNIDSKEKINETKNDNQKNINGCSEPTSRYSRLLSESLEFLRDIDDASILSSIILELPAISPAVYDFIEYFLESSDEIGLEILRNLIIQRPTCREALSLLLAQTESPVKKIRSRTLQYVTELYSIESAVPKIREYAYSSLSKIRASSSNQQKASDESKSIQFKKETIRAQVKAQISLPLAISRFFPEILHQIAEIYIQASPDWRMAISLHTCKTIVDSESPALINLIESCPPGAENLIVAIIENSTLPSLVVRTIIKAFDSGALKDATLIISVIRKLTVSQLLKFLPKIVVLPSARVKTAISRLLSPGSPISPDELLINLNIIPVDLAAAAKAITMCFDEGIRQEALTKALQQLVMITPLPPVVMRTIILTLDYHPTLQQEVVTVLIALIRKQIWESNVLWPGFILACVKALPLDYNSANPVRDSIDVLMQLPAEQLQRALTDEKLRKRLNEVKTVRRELPKPIRDALQISNPNQRRK